LYSPDIDGDVFHDVNQWIDASRWTDGFHHTTSDFIGKFDFGTNVNLQSPHGPCLRRKSSR
jgi:hypothetical protein